MNRLLASGIALIVLVALGAAGQAETLSDDQIRTLFTDNSVTGRYVDGQFFSEFHAADGHAYGENRSVPNTDACWITKPGGVCYYYGPPERRSLFCFTVEKSGDAIVLINAPPNRNAGKINALAKIEPGNPRNLSDNGKPWQCDGLISRKGEPHRLATLP